VSQVFCTVCVNVNLWCSVTVNFYDDILIPAESLQHPARFDESEQLWVWEYSGEDESHDLFMDIGEDIRFRVIDETFTDTSPTGPEGMLFIELILSY